MSGTFLSLPRRYELDDCFFILLVRFIRYEIRTNLNNYPYKLGLTHFVADIEKHGWYAYAQTVIDLSPYCGSVKSHPEFIECLTRVDSLLRSFGQEIPPEWKDKLKVTPDDIVPIQLPLKDLIYWLDCLNRTVEEYKPFTGITTFPFPPAAN
jgi:hypothetical protein